jgi:hypothetical protein
VKRQEKHLVSCWHLADNESFAFWNSYAKEKNGRKVAAIRFLRKDLVGSVLESVHLNDMFYYTRKFIHGGIRYLNLMSIKAKNIEDLLVKYPAFRKEAVFKFENEYRFVISLTKKFEKEGFLYRLIADHRLQYHVLLNPLMEHEEYLQIKEELTKSGFRKYLADSELLRWLHPNG